MTAAGVCLASRAPLRAQFVPKGSGALTKTRRDQLTPTQVIAELKKGLARTNVTLGLESVRKRSAVLKELETKKAIAIVGALHDVTTATVEFLA